MPKTSNHPKFRTHVKKGANGQVWVSYWFDMRGTGQSDIPLGTDHARALIKWDELYYHKKRVAGTIEEAFSKFETDKANGLPSYESAETRRGYTKALRRLRPVFGPESWTDIGITELKNYLNNRIGEKIDGKGGVQANRELSLLSIVWNKARLWGMHDIPWPAHAMERSRWKNKEGKRRIKVQYTVFDAVYKHADQLLRDCMDLSSATGLRITDCRLIPLGAEDEMLEMVSSKKGKEIEFDVLASKVLPALIARRKAMDHVCHDYLLTTENGKQVSYRMLRDRWVEARAAAAGEAREAGNLALATKIDALWLRDMRKFAAQLCPTPQEAQRLLQHGKLSTTMDHYRVGELVKPPR